MHTAGTLFDSPQDRAQQRAYAVLRGEIDGAIEPTASQRAILRILADRPGKAMAISAADLARLANSDDRRVRNDVRDLRLIFKVRIGSARGEGNGYYLAVTREERLETVRPFANQIYAEAAIIRAMLDPHELAELEGQMQLTIPETPEAPHVL